MTAQPKKRNTKLLATVPLMAACLALLSVISLPAGPLAVNFATLGLGLMALLLPKGAASLACVIYLALGAVGLPVFAGFMGGFGHLAGPSGGFLLSYPLAVFLMSALCEKKKPLWGTYLCLLAGLFVIYLFGGAFYCLQPIFLGKQPLDWRQGAMLCLPFLPFDLLKLAAALFIGEKATKRHSRCSPKEKAKTRR